MGAVLTGFSGPAFDKQIQDALAAQKAKAPLAPPTTGAAATTGTAGLGGVKVTPGGGTGVAGTPNAGLTPPPATNPLGGALQGASNPLGNAVTSPAPPAPPPTTPTVPQTVAQQTAASATPSGTSLLPDPLTNAFQGATQVLGQLGTSALSSLQPAQNFMNSMFGSALTPQEQSFMQSSGNLAQQSLNNQVNQLEGQFQGSPFHSALAPAVLDAQGQFTNQMNQAASGLATQREQAATSMASQPFQGAFQAATGIPALSSQLFNTLQGESLGGVGSAIGALGQAVGSAPVATTNPTKK